MLFIISSCSIKSYKPISESEKTKITVPHIFDINFEKALYKTTIDIYGNNITGLTLIKKTDNAYRVVSMSELGLKYFDIEFPFDKQKPTKVHYIMEALNKKLLIKVVNNDFNLIFFPPETGKSQVMINNDDNEKMLITHKKFVYFFNFSGNITEIKKRHLFMKKKSLIRISGYEKNYPQSIYIDHGSISFDFAGIVNSN